MWRICFSAWQLLKPDMEEPETHGSMDAQGEIKEEIANMQDAVDTLEDMAEDVAVLVMMEADEHHRASAQVLRAECPWSQARYSTTKCP